MNGLLNVKEFNGSSGLEASDRPPKGVASRSRVCPHGPVDKIQARDGGETDRARHDASP